MNNLNYYNQFSSTKNVENNLFDPYQGYVKGNMFANLYNGYKYDNNDLSFKNNKEELMTYLSALSFASHDIALYLDVYPNEKNMINIFNEYKNQANQLIQTYEKEYGPLNHNSKYLNKYPWQWDNNPWPWEN